MHEEFDTYELAKEDLEKRRKKAYEDIEKKGDVIVKDNSFAGQSWVHPDKYVSFLLIWTKSMIEDIEEMSRQPDIFEQEREIMEALANHSNNMKK